MRNYRRKASEYKNASGNIDRKVEGEESAGIATREDIWMLRKQSKSHSCTEHQDYAFLQNNSNTKD